MCCRKWLVRSRLHEFGLKHSLHFTQLCKVDAGPIQIHDSLYINLFSRSLFTHRAVVAISAQCFRIGTRIHFEQLREDGVSALMVYVHTYILHTHTSQNFNLNTFGIHSKFWLVHGVLRCCLDRAYRALTAYQTRTQLAQPFPWYRKWVLRAYCVCELTPSPTWGVLPEFVDRGSPTMHPR